MDMHGSPPPQKYLYLISARFIVFCFRDEGGSPQVDHKLAYEKFCQPKLALTGLESLCITSPISLPTTPLWLTTCLSRVHRCGN